MRSENLELNGFIDFTFRRTKLLTMHSVSNCFCPPNNRTSCLGYKSDGSITPRYPVVAVLPMLKIQNYYV